MTILTQYSIVCQVPGAEPYTICAYSGVDLSQVLGITQANMPEGIMGGYRNAARRLLGSAAKHKLPMLTSDPMQRSVT